MSPLLAATIKSVTQPINQLAQTASLFVIVICCYTAVAYFAFGVDEFGAGADRGKVCTSLIECFVYSLYVGIRSGDMDGVLDGADSSNQAEWRGRLIFDLSFFIILGVLLFDVVTGVILDTFGELREEVNDRADKMENETYISGITREKIEEMEGNSVDFTQVNESQQDKWNYLFFMIYLSLKPPEDMTGAETFVLNLMEEEDTTWLPLKTCWAMQNSGIEAEEELSPEEMMEQQGEKLEGVESFIMGLVAKSEAAEAWMDGAGGQLEKLISKMEEAERVREEEEAALMAQLGGGGGRR